MVHRKVHWRNPNLKSLNSLPDFVAIAKISCNLQPLKPRTFAKSYTIAREYVAKELSTHQYGVGIDLQHSPVTKPLNQGTSKNRVS